MPPAKRARAKTPTAASRKADAQASSSGPSSDGPVAVGAKRSRARSASAGASSKRSRQLAILPPPLPVPAHTLPKGSKRQLFVWGNGDMGQFGLGTEALDEIKRPRLHSWIEEKNRAGKLGEHGLEMVAAGGMHTIAIDSRGYVSDIGSPERARADVQSRFTPGASTTMQRLGAGRCAIQMSMPKCSRRSRHR